LRLAVTGAVSGTNVMTRLLFIHAGAVGDFVLSLRLLRAFPDARKSVLGRPEIARLAVVAGLADEVWSIETGRFHSLFSDDDAAAAPLIERMQGFDVALNMLPDGPGRLRRRLTDAGIGRIVDLDPRPRADWTGHITDQWVSDLASVGVPRPCEPDDLRLPPGRVAEGLSTLAGAAGRGDGPIVLMHPGSGSPSKCWPLERFIRLSAQLAAGGIRSVFMLGPVERERWSPAARSETARAGPVLQLDDLCEAAGLIAACDCFVGNDSGMSHMAAALGRPTVAVFGPTDPARWRPLGRCVHVVRSIAPGVWPTVDLVASWVLSLEGRGASGPAVRSPIGAAAARHG
jgi:heptosyltransferase-3